jgi:carbon-monoxide dehydrogenase medium subunit
MRKISAADFFLSLFTTSMDPDELLVDVSLPILGPGHQAGFAEFARRAGDFAIVAVGTDLEIVDGRVEHASVCIGGVSDRPFRSAAAERLLRGQIWPANPTESALVLEAAAAAAEEVEPPTDSHGDGQYRRDLVRALLPRAIAKGVPT